MKILVFAFMFVSVPSIGDNVAKFAEKNIGKQVGNGECSDLAIHALKSVKGKQFPSSYKGKDYVWGILSATFMADSCPKNKLKTGDILQFRDAKFITVKELEGGVNVTTTAVFLHHTAIVVEVSDDGQRAIILHQNVNDDKTVQRSELDMRCLKQGIIKAYRPMR